MEPVPGRVEATAQPNWSSAASIWTPWQLLSLKGRKRDIASHLIIHCVITLDTFIFASLHWFLPLQTKRREEKLAVFIHKRVNYCSPICGERPQRWSLTKLGLKVKCEFSPTSFYIWFLLCSLQALLYLSSNLVPHPLASHPEFLAQCRKFSQLPEVWCIPGLFLIWALISSKNEAIYQCFSNISGEFF